MADSVDFQRYPIRNTGIFFASARRRHCSAEQFKIFATAFNPIVGSTPLPDCSFCSCRPLPGTSNSCECWLVDMHTPVIRPADQPLQFTIVQHLLHPFSF